MIPSQPRKIKINRLLTSISWLQTEEDRIQGHRWSKIKIIIIMDYRYVGRKEVHQILAEGPRVEQLLEGKLAYILADKESVSGMFNNRRFIVLNGKDLTLGYSNVVPMELPIGGFVNVKHMKKRANLEDVLIQRSKHKLKAIEIICQKFKYKDRPETIPEEWVFFLSSTKAADETVELFNNLKAEMLANGVIKPPQIIPQLVSQVLVEESKMELKQAAREQQASVKQQKASVNQQKASVREPKESSRDSNELSMSHLSNYPSSKRKSEIKITSHPVVDISISNVPYVPRENYAKSVRAIPVDSQIHPSKPMYSQINNRYQITSNAASIPAYSQHNHTVMTHPVQLSVEVPLSYEASQRSINMPVTHHPNSPKMPQSMVAATRTMKANKEYKYELQVRPVEHSAASSANQTKYTHPSNSKLTQIHVVNEVSEKSSVSIKTPRKEISVSGKSQSDLPSSAQMHIPNFSSDIRVNIDSSRREIPDFFPKEPMSPIIPVRERKVSRYALNSSNLNLGSGSESPNSPNSPRKFSPNREKMVNIWEQQQPAVNNNNFTLTSSPIRNNASPAKVQPQREQSANKAKRRRTEYTVGKESRDWNQEMYFSVDPLDTLVKFQQFSSQAAMDIINSFGSHDMKHTVVSEGDSQTVFEHQNLILTMWFNPNSDKAGNKMERNEVENYIYLTDALQNKEFCRVPLVNLVEYKSIKVLVKAQLNNFTKVNKASLGTEVKKLEALTRISREEFNRCTFKLVTYFNRGSSHEVIFIDDLEQLIPNGQKAFRRELVELAAREKGVIESIFLSKLLQRQKDSFLSRLEKLEIMVLSSGDLVHQLHHQGIGVEELGEMCNKTCMEFIKEIITSELLSEVALSLFSVHLQNQIKNLVRNKQRHSDRFLVQAAYEFMDDLCSATNNSEALWDVIIIETESRFKLKVERKHLMWGYFLGAFLQKSGLKFNINSLDKSQGFTEEYNCISAHSLEGFGCVSRSSRVDYVESIANTKGILEQEPSELGYQKLNGYLQYPSYLAYIKEHPLLNTLLVYLSHFIPGDISTKTVLNPYEELPHQPSSYTTIQLALSKMKWLLKHKDEEAAVTLLEESCELINFWGAEFHPLMSEFYDLLSAYYITTGEPEEGLTLGRSSLVNTIKLVGSSSLATCDKFYLLANIMYRINKLEEALAHFSKAREILLQHSVINVVLGEIELKLSSLYIHFNRLPDAELASLEALQIFEQTNQQHLTMDAYELIDSLYTIQQNPEAIKKNALQCAHKLDTNRDPEVYTRMLKLSLSPFLRGLSTSCKKALVDTIQMLNLSQSKKEYLSWLFKRSNIVETLSNYLRNIDLLVPEMKLSTLQKYRGIHVKTDSQLFNFLALLEAVLGVVEVSPLMVILRDYE